MRFLTLWFFVVHLAGMCCLVLTPSYANPVAYRSQQHSIGATRYGLKQHKINATRTDVVIYNTITKRVVWMKKLSRIDDSHHISWSADHKAVAIVDDSDEGGYHIIVWNASRKVQTISSIPLSAHSH